MDIERGGNVEMKTWLFVLTTAFMLAACGTVTTHFTERQDVITAKAEEMKLEKMKIVGEENIAGTDSVLYVFRGEKDSGETIYYVSLVESQEEGYVAIETLDLRTPQSSETVTGDYMSAQFLTPNAEVELAPYEVLVELETGDVLLVTF